MDKEELQDQISIIYDQIGRSQRLSDGGHDAKASLVLGLACANAFCLIAESLAQIADSLSLKPVSDIQWIPEMETKDILERIKP